MNRKKEKEIIGGIQWPAKQKFEILGGCFFGQ